MLSIVQHGQAEEETSARPEHAGVLNHAGRDCTQQQADCCAAKAEEKDVGFRPLPGRLLWVS